jgi:ArsR family transcriptional regulator
MSLVRAAGALADPIRIRILALLANPDAVTMPCCPTSPLGICVCNIAHNLRVSQPRVSYHLRILREAGFVTENPKGKWSHYTLARHSITQFCNELQILAVTKEELA